MSKWRIKITVQEYSDFIAELPDKWLAEDVKADAFNGYEANGGFRPFIEVERVEDDAEVGDIG